jgi:hypothetical protein
MKKLFFGLLAVGMISSSLFGYSIYYKDCRNNNDGATDYTCSIKLNCDDGSSGYLLLYKVGNLYAAKTSGYNKHWGNNINQVFDQTAREACGE